MQRNYNFCEKYGSALPWTLFLAFPGLLTSTSVRFQNPTEVPTPREKSRRVEKALATPLHHHPGTRLLNW